MLLDGHLFQFRWSGGQVVRWWLWCLASAQEVSSQSLCVLLHVNCQLTIVLCCFSSRDQLTVIMCKSLLYTSTSVHMTILTDGPVQLVIASDAYLSRSVVTQPCLSLSTRQISCVTLHTAGLSPGPGIETYTHF